MSKRGILKALDSYCAYQKDKIIKKTINTCIICQQNSLQPTSKVNTGSSSWPTLPRTWWQLGLMESMLMKGKRFYLVVKCRMSGQPGLFPFKKTRFFCLISSPISPCPPTPLCTDSYQSLLCVYESVSTLFCSLDSTYMCLSFFDWHILLSIIPSRSNLCNCINQCNSNKFNKNIFQKDKPWWSSLNTHNSHFWDPEHIK